MDKQDYINKINVILSVNSKFTKIDKDPSNILMTQGNKLISVLVIKKRALSLKFQDILNQDISMVILKYI